MKLRISLAVIATCVSLAFGASSANAQATRTWVSGVGDDVNPCSRTAPCKTFSGAISKTAAGGEINCLDPGGFGAVTITKSMTISCPYTEGGALAGGNGITVNAGPTDVVYLRGLDIFGVNPPIHGVRFIAGGALHIEDCVIRRFNAANSFGVSFTPNGTSRLFISNTLIANNGTATTGGGINIQPSLGGTANVFLNNVRIVDNAFHAINFNNTAITGNLSNLVITDSVIFGNGENALNASTNANVLSIMLSDVVIANNKRGLVLAGAGLNARIGGSTIASSGSAIQLSAGAVLQSYKNNLIDLNSNNGTPIPQAALN